MLCNCWNKTFGMPVTFAQLFLSQHIVHTGYIHILQLWRNQSIHWYRWLHNNDYASVYVLVWWSFQERGHKTARLVGQLCGSDLDMWAGWNVWVTVLGYVCFFHTSLSLRVHSKLVKPPCMQLRTGRDMEACVTRSPRTGSKSPPRQRSRSPERRREELVSQWQVRLYCSS